MRSLRLYLACGLAAVFSFILQPSPTVKASMTFTGRNLYTEKLEELKLQPAENALVLFMSAECPCSQAHEKEVLRLTKKYKGDNLKVWLVLSNRTESKEELQKHFKEFQSQLVVIHDENQELANQYGAYKTPHAFIRNSKGESLYEGGVSNSRGFEDATEFYLAQALDQISQGKADYKKRTRALGCEIQR